MFGISFEHILIVGVILLIVGPKRLPELGNTLGKSIKNFKDSFGAAEELNLKNAAKKMMQAETETAQITPSKTQTPSETHV